MILKLSIGFIVFLLIVILIEQIRRRKSGTEVDITPEKEHNHSSDTSEVCCGAHEVCEKNLLSESNIEYYDDEELDVYKGRNSDKYEDAEIEEFREVLYTMQEKDVAGWLKSLQSREIELPDELKDEAFILNGARYTVHGAR